MTTLEGTSDHTAGPVIPPSFGVHSNGLHPSSSAFHASGNSSTSLSSMVPDLPAPEVTSTAKSPLSPRTRPAVSVAALYRTLRSEELQAYCHIVRSFIAQGLVLDSSRLRMLSDLRGMLHIPDARHDVEVAAAQADARLAQIAAQKIHERRHLFKDASHQPGILFSTDGGYETEDLPEDKVSARHPKQPGGRKRKLPFSTATSTTAGSANQKESTGQQQPPPRKPLSVEEYQKRYVELQQEMIELQNKISQATPRMKEVYNAQLVARMRELNEIVEQLDQEDEEDANQASGYAYDQEGRVDEDALQNINIVDLPPTPSQRNTSALSDEAQSIMQNLLGMP